MTINWDKPIEYVGGDGSTRAARLVCKDYKGYDKSKSHACFVTNPSTGSESLYTAHPDGSTTCGQIRNAQEKKTATTVTFKDGQGNLTSVIRVGHPGYIVGHTYCPYGTCVNAVEFEYTV